MDDFLTNLIAGERSAILVAAAAYFAFFGLWSVIFCVRVRQWPSIIGTLDAATLTKFGWAMVTSDQDYRANARYKYEVNGQTYEGTRLSPSIMIVSHNLRGLLRWQIRGIERSGNDKVRVYYKPSNPAKSYLIVPSNRTIAIVAITMFGAALLIYWAI